MNKPPVEMTHLEKTTDDLLSQMESFTGDDDEYAKMVEQYVKLNSCKPEKALPLIRADTIVAVIGNLLGILLILGFEHTNVITSKAMSFVLKAKL